MSARPPSAALPLPDEQAAAHGARVVRALRDVVREHGGWLPFEAYMRFVLYAPELGYYTAGATKLGAAGDFTTAPEMTPLYAQALAAQVAALLRPGADEIVELGAGSGRLGADLLAALPESALPSRYAILDVSADLRERQQALLAERVPLLRNRIVWVDALPERIAGVVLMNEVLDAIPCALVVRRGGAWLERGVAFDGERLAFADRPLAPGAVLDLARRRFPPDGDYASEVNPAAEALVESLGRRLAHGALLAIDYGFPRHEYYHPQRAQGTLMAHYRHRALADPLAWPGLCDLTAHVDFTAIAEAGERAGLHVAGFATQAAFLMGCGVLDRLQAVGAPESAAYVREAGAVQRLLSPAEMGELFKVLALARDEGLRGPGFALADMRHRL
ncbi:MAG TPA: SAM-dependent methyltransferase [Casimicrobiaceae bacterium]|nr:SAM-dependent methyltransferase [Casimicrobiaceae bacterium]